MSAPGHPPPERAAGPLDIYTLGPLRRTYLTVTMDRVSRSFALVVPWLEDPLQDHMATAYLLCRVLDNIEDCSEPVHWRRQRVAEFVELLEDPGLAPQRMAEWSAAPWPGLSDDERALMTLEGGLPLWLIFSTFPARTRSIFRNWIPMMAEGMEAVFDPAQSGAVVLCREVRTLATAEDYNDYCYSVAGTVGGLGTELVADHYGLSPHRARLLVDGSEACGRALQKTNVLKDFVEDLRRRVCFLPDEWLREIDHRPLGLDGAPAEWVGRLLGDILGELRASTRYVLEVPREAAGYRIACLMCLLPAYETILSAARDSAALFTPAHQIKISHSAIARCIHRAVALAADDDAIAAFSRDFEQRIGEALRSPEPVPSLGPPRLDPDPLAHRR